MSNNIFIDTSSLIKRYVFEQGSDKLDAFFLPDNIFFISQITRIEFNSALKRRLNDNTITDDDYKKILFSFDIDFPFFSVVNLNLFIENKSIELINKYQMKTLDSIQLSSALLQNIDLFLTSDKKLFVYSKKELNDKCIFIEWFLGVIYYDLNKKA